MQLRPFQREGVDFIKSHSHILLADEPGLGKTVQVIKAIDEAALFPCLVLCPCSLKEVWRKHFLEWANVTATVDKVSDITITNYEKLNKVLPQLKEIKWDILICDESHLLSNKKTKRFRNVRQLARTASRVALLTGTPIMNRPLELLGQLDLLRATGKFGGERAFLETFCGATLTKYGWDFTGATNLVSLHKKLSGVFLRRTKEEVAIELPSKAHAVVPITIKSREYHKAEKAFVGGHLERFEKLRMLAVRAKEKACFDWIDNFLASGEKLVVFAHHRELQQALLARWPGACSILGSQSSSSRKQAVESFQSGKANLIVCSLQAAGVGLTLTAASNVAFLEFPWTPGLLNQAIDRVHRITQTKPVTAWYLYAADTIEEDMLCLCENKEVITSIVHDGRVVIKNIVKKMMGVE